jgi:hypothetical protein
MALLVLIRVFLGNKSDNDLFKIYREIFPHLSKNKIVDLIQKKKAHRDWAFGCIFIILIFSFLIQF